MASSPCLLAARLPMRSWTLRMLALLGVGGCGVWIGTSPKDVEPYITLAGAIAGVLAMFREQPRAEVTLALRDQNEHIQAFVFENLGGADALDLNMTVHYQEGQTAPVHQGQPRLPVSVLYPRQRHLVRISCVIESGVEFDVEWSWLTRGQKKREVRRAPITLERNGDA